MTSITVSHTGGGGGGGGGGGEVPKIIEKTVMYGIGPLL